MPQHTILSMQPQCGYNHCSKSSSVTADVSMDTLLGHKPSLVSLQLAALSFQIKDDIYTYLALHSAMGLMNVCCLCTCSSWNCFCHTMIEDCTRLVPQELIPTTKLKWDSLIITNTSIVDQLMRLGMPSKDAKSLAFEARWY